MLNLEYAHMTAARRAVVFALEPHESASDRRAEAAQARKLVEQAACLAVRAGRPDVANDALTLLAKLEAGK
jgi:phage shock protein A